MGGIYSTIHQYNQPNELNRPNKPDYFLPVAEGLCSAKLRPGGPDQPDYFLLEAEELCDLAVRPRLVKPDRLYLLSLPCLYCMSRVALYAGLSPGKVRSKLLCSLSGF